MLNDTLIRSLKSLEKPKKYYDAGGLFLYVPITGSKLWRMAYNFNGKSKLLSFGEYPAVSLKMARERREEAKRLLAEEIDPSQHKKERKAAKRAEEANSFKSVALEWHTTQTLHIMEAGRISTLYRLNHYLFPQIGKIPVSKLEAQHILAIVKPLEEQGLLDRAHYIIQLCGRVLRYAIATGKAKHDVTADLRGAIRTKRPKHRPTIFDARKIGNLLSELDNHPGYFPVKCALRLMPLLFVRERELIEAEWTEFDLDAQEWRIPAQRMKMREQHIVPLSKQAIAILEELKTFTGLGKYLFPSARKFGVPISKSTLLAVLRRNGYKTDEMCIHGFRSMASTLLNELGFNSDWIERQLAHTESNSVRAAYNHAQYLPERRRMMQAWSDHLDGLREKTQQENAKAQPQTAKQGEFVCP